MIRRHFFLFAALIAVGLMIAAGVWRLTTASGEESAGRGPGGPGGGGPGGRATVVAVTQIQNRSFSDSIAALGVAKARQSVSITSNTTEQITRVFFTSGQTVDRGDLLIQFEAREQQAGVLQAQAALRQAQRDFTRQQTLFERGYVAQARLDDARATVETAQAALGAVQAVQGDRAIRAPFSGVIGLSDAAPGQLITPGVQIATLDDLNVIYVDFDIPERFLNVLRAGLPLTATADAYGDEPFQGRIERINTRVDPGTRAVTARAAFANPGLRIKPGMLMRIAVEEGTRRSPSSPEAAVQFEGDLAYVFKIVDRDGSTVAQRADVRTGVRESGFVEILEGANAGERIVADGVNRVQPNQPVRIANAPAAAGRPQAAVPAQERRPT